MPGLTPESDTVKAAQRLLPAATPASPILLLQVGSAIRRGLSMLIRRKPLGAAGAMVLCTLIAVALLVVFGFLLVLALFYSRPATWVEIGSGFFAFGNVPVQTGEDANGGSV